MKREDVTKVFESATDEQVNALLDINSADIGKAKSKLEAERDNYKSQLDTAQETLKGFEGVDVKDLQGKVTELQNTLAAKETEYQNKLADMEFSSILDGAISSSGARSSKALKALLDVDALKASKNQTEDIKTAIESVKADNDYLFKSDEPFKNPVAPTSTGGNSGGNPLAAVRAAMGLPDETK